MHVLSGGCSVIEPHEGEWRFEGAWRFRTPISTRMGAKCLAQTESRYATGLSPGRRNPSSDEVHYVVAGSGQCFIDGFGYPVESGSAMFVPKGSEFTIENENDSEILVVSVTCPGEPGEKEAQYPLVPRTVPLTSYHAPARVVNERDRAEVQSGGGTLRVLADKDLGCEGVTPFIARVPRGASAHADAFERAIYVLEGSGILRAGNDTAPFRPGTSIHLPPRARHSLENPSFQAVGLLGVLYPPGTPADCL